MGNNNMPSTRRKVVLGLAASSLVLHIPSKWSKPIINSVITPAHAQTSGVTSLCADGVSTWLMSNYQENGVSFNQGEPQSQVEITISGTQISLVTDWSVINSNSNAISRGRVTDVGTIDLTSGEASTSPSGSPSDSPTHGALANLANNLAQRFTLDCQNSGSFVVRDTGGVYSFTLTRIS